MGPCVRVLLAAKHPPQGRLRIGGVQSWVATVAGELTRRGHDVECWGPELSVPAGRFDIGIFANMGDTGWMVPICDRVLVVAHGIIAPEKPSMEHRCVYTSEGVRDHWKGGGPVIRQPIDLGFWSPGESAELAAVVRYGYYEGLPFLSGVAKRLRMPFRRLFGVTHDEARSAMRSAIVVLASGRAALEAAACGAAVVICDDRPYQGPLLAPFGEGQMRQNYSGRGGVVPDADSVLSAVRDAIANRDAALAHVREHHDARKVVDVLLKAAA